MVKPVRETLETANGLPNVKSRDECTVPNTLYSLKYKEREIGRNDLSLSTWIE